MNTFVASCRAKSVGLRACGGSLLRHSVPTTAPLSSLATPTHRLDMPMKAGTPIPGLDIYQDKEAPVALERTEYPEWLGSLAQPMVSLARLRKMPEEQATDKDKKRYLKLVRRLKIKEKNEEAKAK